jgi:hypothetical protein
MFFVTYRNTDTGKTHTDEFTSERDAMRCLTNVELYTNLELISTNVDASKFRR